MSQPFTLMLTLGAVAGLLWLGMAPHADPGRAGPAARARLDAAAAALVVGLLGARLGFVMGRWPYYAAHPGQAWRTWEGGLSWAGGALGALAGLALYAAWSRRSFWHLADALAAPATIVSAAAWTGCLLEGCAYGRRLPASWWAPAAPDLFGNLTPRWPAQSLGAVYSLVLLLALVRLGGRAVRPGLRACLTLAALALGALALSALRADPVGSWAGLRLDALGAMLVLLAASAGLALSARRA